MVEHWEAAGPPVYMAVAGYLKLGKGYSNKKSKNAPKETGNLEELAAMFAGSGGVIN